MIRLTQTGKQAWVMRAAASEGLGFPDLEANLGTRPAAGRVVQPELSSGTPGAGFRGEGGSVGSGGDLPPSFLPHCPPPLHLFLPPQGAALLELGGTKGLYGFPSTTGLLGLQLRDPELLVPGKAGGKGRE